MAFHLYIPSRLPPSAEAKNVFSDYHVAFHGTAPGNVQRILDTGHLVLPGQFGIYVATCATLMHMGTLISGAWTLSMYVCMSHHLSIQHVVVQYHKELYYCMFSE